MYISQTCWIQMIQKKSPKNFGGNSTQGSAVADVMRFSAFPLENPPTRPQDPRSTYSWSPSPQCNCHSTSATPPGDQLRCRALEKSTSLGALRIFQVVKKNRIKKPHSVRPLHHCCWSFWFPNVPHACAQVIPFQKLEKVCIVSDDSTYNPSFLVRSSNLPVASTWFFCCDSLWWSLLGRKP